MQLCQVSALKNDPLFPVYLARFQCGDDFDVLIIVELEVGRCQFAGMILDVECFGESENACVEGPSFPEVLNLERHSCNTHDRQFIERGRCLRRAAAAEAPWPSLPDCTGRRCLSV